VWRGPSLFFLFWALLTQSRGRKRVIEDTSEEEEEEEDPQATQALPQASTNLD
jgi:hypothetical protein